MGESLGAALGGPRLVVTAGRGRNGIGSRTLGVGGERREGRVGAPAARGAGAPGVKKAPGFQKPPCPKEEGVASRDRCHRPRQRIWLLVGHSSLYKGHREEKPLWKGLSREGAEEGEEAVWGEQRGEREPRWGHSARVEIPHERACEHAACARECVHAGACVSVCWRCAVYAVVLHMCVYVLVCAAH